MKKITHFVFTLVVRTVSYRSISLASGFNSPAMEMAQGVMVPYGIVHRAYLGHYSRYTWFCAHP